MTGDQSDFFARIKARMPSGWFGSDSPILDALIGGIASAFVTVYAAYQYLLAQTRLQTSTDGWLDLAAADYFGESGLPRLQSETDAAYRTRIKINIIRERGTRAALVKILTDLTGRAPVIVEPARPQDTGAYGGLESVTLVGSPMIYRNDWQGNQLLYATSRTNVALQSSAFDNSSWSKLNATVTANVASNPDGTTTADRLIDNATNGEHRVTQTWTDDLTQNWSLSADVQSGTGSLGMLLAIYDTSNFNNFVRAQFVNNGGVFSLASVAAGGLGANATAQCVLAPDGLNYRLSVSGSPNSTLPSGTMRANINLFAAGASATGIYVGSGNYNSLSNAQIERSGVPTGRISTTTAPVSVTDYALTGSTPTFAFPPVSGALLTWSGVYTSQTITTPTAVSGQWFGTGDGVSTAFAITRRYACALGYGLAGAYGSLLHNYQAFVTAYRPSGSGIPYVQGYGTSPGGYATPSRAAYANIGQMTAGVTDAAIYAAIASVLPVATIAWVAISN
jgi:hypothetical protein